jgi:hypothetical protein
MDEVLESWAEGLYRTDGVDASEASSGPANAPRAYPHRRTADRPAAGDDAPTALNGGGSDDAARGRADVWAPLD